ncbi:MAG: hypothetical protein JNM27_01835 [Leptospirales bacterium]|nr:hypothetical protein [Leptospirales bacterium]
MKQFYRFLVAGLFFLGLNIAVNLTSAESPASLIAQEKEKPYEGDIREADLRRRELIEKIKKNEIPASIRLRYSRREGDFLEFYDLEGKPIYYKYREDRFDSDGDARIQFLISGGAYEVTGKFLGLYRLSKLYSPESPEFSSQLEDLNSIPVFLFKGARALRTDQILL